jgi:hypothetical protein
MTIGGWISFGILAATILGFAIFAACDLDSAASKALALIVGMILVAAIGAGFFWYYNGTASGQRALKTQESNLDGGLSRTVTVYRYSGDEIASWSGKFDVTENDQETYFDIDGRRIIIQGGIIINEEEPKE